jgi:hypothetical protein
MYGEVTGGREDDDDEYGDEEEDDEDDGDEEEDDREKEQNEKTLGEDDVEVEADDEDGDGDEDSDKGFDAGERLAGERGAGMVCHVVSFGLAKCCDAARGEAAVWSPSRESDRGDPKWQRGDAPLEVGLACGMRRGS